MNGHLCEEEVLSGACGPDLLHLLTCPAYLAWADRHNRLNGAIR